MLDKAEKDRPELIIMDINLGQGGNGIDAAKRINEHNKIPIVFLSTDSDEDTDENVIEASTYGYLVKPFKPQTLKTTLILALRRHELEQDVLKKVQA